MAIAANSAGLASDTTRPGDGATGAESYTWLPTESLSNANIANPIAIPTSTTTYKVKGTKAGFCDVQDSIKVNVNSRGSGLINPPLIFSPNGDGINDAWKVLETELFPDCLMSIYDGHGSKIYEQRGYNSANYWEGNLNGKEVPDGTYYYVFGCPDSKSATGSVLVVR